MNTLSIKFALSLLAGASLSLSFSFYINEELLLNLSGYIESVAFTGWFILWPPGIYFVLANDPSPAQHFLETITCAVLMSTFYAFLYYAVTKIHGNIVLRCIAFTGTYIVGYIACLILFLAINWIFHALQI